MTSAAVSAATSEAAKHGSWKSIATASAGAAGTATCGPVCGAVAAKLTDVVTHAQWQNHQGQEYQRFNAAMNVGIKQMGLKPQDIVNQDLQIRHHTPAAHNPYVQRGIAAGAPEFFYAGGSGTYLQINPAAVYYYQHHDFPRDGYSHAGKAGEEATFGLLAFCASGFPIIAGLAAQKTQIRVPLLHLAQAKPSLFSRHPVATTAAAGGGIGLIVWGLIKYGILHV